MATNRRFLAIGIAIGLLAGVITGAGVVAAQGPSTLGTPVGPPASAPPAGATGSAIDAAGTTLGTISGSAASGAAIAYPYPIVGGTPGIAPDHSIVVSGTGSADQGANGSDRAAAEKTALTEALADAKNQADIIAAVTGVSIKGVVSVSASVGSFGPIPLMGGATGGAPTVGAPARNLPLPIWPTQLTVSVTVVYGIN